MWHEIKPIVLPLIMIGAGGLIGIFIQKVVLAKLRPSAITPTGMIDRLLVHSLRGMPFFWSLIISIYGAIHAVPMNEHILSFLEKALLILILFSTTIVVARLIVSLVSIYAQRVGGIISSTSIFVNLAEVATYAIGIMIILQSLGISITPILTALGVGGIAVALALQDTLTNLFSGLHILLSKQIKPGDYIKLGSGEQGYIADITWRNMTITGTENNLIVIPNSKIASATVTNYTLPEPTILTTIKISVAYNNDLEHVETVTRQTAQQVLQQMIGRVVDCPPQIYYHTFTESSIELVIIVSVHTFADQYPVRHTLMKRLHGRYQKESIVFPSPLRVQ